MNEVGAWDNVVNVKKGLHPITSMAASGADKFLSSRLNPNLSARIMKSLAKNQSKTRRFAYGSNTPALNTLKRSHHLANIAMGSRAMNTKRRSRLFREQRELEERERQLRKIEEYKQAAIDRAMAELQAIKREEQILESDRERLMKAARSSTALKTLNALEKKRLQRNMARTRKAKKHAAK